MRWLCVRLLCACMGFAVIVPGFCAETKPPAVKPYPKEFWPKGERDAEQHKAAGDFYYVLYNAYAPAVTPKAAQLRVKRFFDQAQANLKEGKGAGSFMVYVGHPDPALVEGNKEAFRLGEDLGAQNLFWTVEVPGKGVIRGGDVSKDTKLNRQTLAQWQKTIQGAINKDRIVVFLGQLTKKTAEERHSAFTVVGSLETVPKGVTVGSFSPKGLEKFLEQLRAQKKQGKGQFYFLGLFLEAGNLFRGEAFSRRWMKTFAGPVSDVDGEDIVKRFTEHVKAKAKGGDGLVYMGALAPGSDQKDNADHAAVTQKG